MKFKTKDHEFVVTKLLAMEPRYKSWARVCMHSGVPRSTLNKIVYGETENPGCGTIEELKLSIKALKIRS